MSSAHPRLLASVDPRSRVPASGGRILVWSSDVLQWGLPLGPPPESLHHLQLPGCLPAAPSHHNRLLRLHAQAHGATQCESHRQQLPSKRNICFAYFSLIKSTENIMCFWSLQSLPNSSFRLMQSEQQQCGRESPGWWWWWWPYSSSAGAPSRFASSCKLLASAVTSYTRWPTLHYVWCCR